MQKSALVPIGTALLFVALIFGGYALVQYSGAHGFALFPGTASSTEYRAPEPLSADINPSTLAEATPPPTGYVQYTNAKYGFSFYHAPEATVHEYDEGGGAETITLQDLKLVRGLQIFIVPYTGTSISDQRFHEDEPSGVRNNVQNTQVDGVPAVTFTSVSTTLGNTREVWFLHNGYLFEVTTFAGAADWFTPIMQSWHFL